MISVKKKSILKFNENLREKKKSVSNLYKLETYTTEL